MEDVITLRPSKNGGTMAILVKTIGASTYKLNKVLTKEFVDTNSIAELIVHMNNEMESGTSGTNKY